MKGKILVIVLVSIFLISSMCYFNIVPKALAPPDTIWNFNTCQTEYHVDPNTSFNITSQVMMYQFRTASVKLYAELMRLEGWTFKVIVPAISTLKTWYNVKISITVPEHPKLNYYGVSLFGNTTVDGRDWNALYFICINGNSTPINYHPYYNYTDYFVEKEDYPRSLYLPVYDTGFEVRVWFNPNTTGIYWVDVMYWYPDGGWCGTTGIPWSVLSYQGSHGTPWYGLVR